MKEALVFQKQVLLSLFEQTARFPALSVPYRCLSPQINELKSTLEILARENAESKDLIPQLDLKWVELNDCAAQLSRVRKSKQRCENWADDVDTNATFQTHEASLRMQEERRAAAEAKQKVGRCLPPH